MAIIYLLGFAVATFVFTILGGLLARRFGDKLHLALGFSAGVVIATAFLDIIPETVHLRNGTENIRLILLSIIGGFLIYHILERLSIFHYQRELLKTNLPNPLLAAANLVIHSLLDGIVIGLAFRAGLAVGIPVGIAVISHDWTDGVSVVSILLSDHKHLNQTWTWLFADAITPVIGVFIYFIGFSPQTLAWLLALIAGSLLYVGATDLLPEAHHKHSSWPTVMATIFGVGLIVLVTQFLG